MLKGQCLSVYRCCGEDPESTYVVPPHPVPGEPLSSLAQRVAELGYESSISDNTSMTVLKRVSTGPDTTRIGYYAEFDGEYGFPIRITALGPSAPYSILRSSYFSGGEIPYGNTPPFGWGSKGKL